MLTRRCVNKILAGSVLLPASFTQLLAADRQQQSCGKLPIHFVFESRAADYGWLEGPPTDGFETIHYIKGDVTRIWYEELHSLWSDKRVLTAGLTRESEFFVLKTLARDYGYRVTKETSSGSHLVSWLLAPNI